MAVEVADADRSNLFLSEIRDVQDQAKPSDLLQNDYKERNEAKLKLNKNLGKKKVRRKESAASLVCVVCSSSNTEPTS